MISLKTEFNKAQRNNNRSHPFEFDLLLVSHVKGESQEHTL